MLSVGSAFGQGISNFGAAIKVESGAVLKIVNGNYINETQSSDGNIELDGVIYLDGDFTNDADAGNVFINSNSDGELIFSGTGSQTISGTGEYIDFEKVTVNSTSITSVSAEKAITVNGVLTIDGSLSLESPPNANPSGSLITNSSISGSGDITVNRHLSTNNRWQYISIPMSNISSTILTEDPNPGYLNPNFYTYNEASDATPDPSSTSYGNWGDFDDTWQRVQTTLGSPVTLVSGEGYSYYNTQNIEAEYTTSTGPENLSTGDMNVTVNYTDNDDGSGYGVYYDGWNLIGNPFPSALDFSALSKTTNMDNALYLWDGNNGNYVYYSPGSDEIQGSGQTLNSNGNSPYIPAMQAFIVHLSASSTVSETFTLANSARTHSNQLMWKEENNPEFPYIKMEISSGANIKTDQTLVRFIEDSAPGFEGENDAFKMFPLYSDVPQIYSLTPAPELPLAINTLSEDDENKTIPLGLFCPVDGNYKISALEMNFPFHTHVFLIDTKSNTYTDLKETPEYNFSMEEGDNRERFYLFSGPDSPTLTQAQNKDYISVWASKRTIFIRNLNSTDIDAQIRVYNVSGKIIESQRMLSGLHKIHIPDAEGLYIVNIINKDGFVTTKKVVINN